MQKTSLRAALAVCLALTALFLYTESARVFDAAMSIYNPKDAETAGQQNPAQVISGAGGLESGYQEVMSDGALCLYFNAKTAAVAVGDVNNGKVWYSEPRDNPELEGKTLTSPCDQVLITLEKQGRSLTLTSGGDVVSDIQKNSVTVKYIFTFEDGDIAGSLPLEVKYYLKNSSFYAEADCAGMDNTDGYVVKSIELLSGLGLCGGGDENFLLLPDGSGALLSLAEMYMDGQTVALPVYGKDKALREDFTSDYPSENHTQTVLPVFGLKDQNNAMLCVIESGDALATVHAARAAKEHELSSVSASFLLTPCDKFINAAGTRAVEYLPPEPYRGVVRLCYRFLSESSANYSSMAVACREELMRAEFLLSIPAIEDGLPVPMNIALVGQSGRAYDFLGSRKFSNRRKTSFPQAEDIVKRSLAKGISNINIRYVGSLKGGVFNGQTNKMIFDRGLGGRPGFMNLQNYLTQHKSGIYADLNLLSVYDTSPQAIFDKSAKAISDTDAVIFAQNPVDPDNVVPGYMLGADAMQKRVEQMLYTNTSKETFGMSIADAGKYLYSDYNSAAPMNRQQMRDKVAKLCETASVNNKIMIDTGNAYSLKRASVIVNQPLSASRSFAGYEDIPFLQMVLHGIADYSGAPINMQEDWQTAMLRAVEYGAAPSFMWVYAPEEDKNIQVKAGLLSYTAWLSIAAEYYKDASEALSGVRSERFIRHEKVASGLYCSHYDNGTRIYVNYSGESQEVEGYTVDARSFRMIKY